MADVLERLGDPLLAATTVQMAGPLLLAVLAALLCARAGLVYLGLEGTMLAGAWVGAAATLSMGPELGLALGALAGAGLALLQAIAVLSLGIDQLVAGLAANVLAFGGARFLETANFGPARSVASAALRRLPRLQVEWLGPISPLAPLALLVGVAVLLALRFGVAGLRLDAAGEVPVAAERAGLNVERLRYGALLAAGALGGLAGAGLAVEVAGHYRPGVSGGLGFLALAVALLAGRSMLAGALGALLVAALDALPAVFPPGPGATALGMAPWLAVLLALVVLARRPRSPRATTAAWRGGTSL